MKEISLRSRLRRTSFESVSEKDARERERDTLSNFFYKALGAKSTVGFMSEFSLVFLSNFIIIIIILRDFNRLN